MAETSPGGQHNLAVKSGIAGGSVLSILGTLITLLGFFLLPWVSSCTGDRMSGFDLAIHGSELAQNMGQNGSSLSYALLCIPGAALIILGLSLLLIPSIFIRQVPATGRTVVSLLLLLFSSMACCISGAFLTYIQSILERYKGVIELESGFWVTVSGIVLGLSGELLSLAAALFGQFRRR